MQHFHNPENIEIQKPQALIETLEQLREALLVARQKIISRESEQLSATLRALQTQLVKSDSPKYMEDVLSKSRDGQELLRNLKRIIYGTDK